MPLQQTTGNVTTDAYGGGVAAVTNYIENVFSTYVYSGNGGTQTINNGIDLATYGGLAWFKARSAAYDNVLYDSSRSLNYSIASNSSAALQYKPIDSFNTNGFSLPGGNLNANASGQNYVSWTFRKQPKFFDVVTYTGDGLTNRNIAHNLGSTPGCIIIKDTTNAGTNWWVWHRSISGTLNLNTTAARGTDTTYFGTINSTVFGCGISPNAINLENANYVAYLFAHNAGGFGLTGTDNVITCGGGTYDSNGYASVNLGYEPQFVLIKSTTYADNWYLADNMRGMAVGSSGSVPYTAPTNMLYPNTTGSETYTDYGVAPNATGFTYTNGSSFQNYIYIAIRRGPMKTPTSGTSVFSPNIASVTGATTITTNFPVDLAITQYRSGYYAAWFDRLRGNTQMITSSSTAAEATQANMGFDNNTGYVDNYNWQFVGNGNFVYWNMRRAPSFFDEVCSTGDGVGTALNHNLTVVPELYIQKRRNIAGQNWFVWAPGGNQLKLNLTDAGTTPGFTIGTSTTFNPISYASGGTYVNYLFATCAGVSKVGTYTGNGSTQTINCGFTGGARFVLIKRTDSTGAWYVYDTARGMTTLTDPYLLLNSTAAESATLGSVTTVSTGFAVNASILAAINTNAASYIFLAIS